MSTGSHARGVLISALLVLVLWSMPSTPAHVSAQPPQPGGPPPLPPGRVVKLDPALDAIVPPGAAIERFDMGYGFTEGPVWTRDNALLFSDVPGNTIFRVTAARQASIFRKPSGYNGLDGRPGQHVGSNGLTFDLEGRLVICEHGNRRVTRLESNGRLTVLADKYGGKRLNSPNDAVVKSDGSIYFTDPPYGLARQDADSAKELPSNGVYRIRNGAAELLSTELLRPNGIGFSPDERLLYVANSDQARRIWMRFEVKPDGTLGSGSVFFDATAESMPGIPDGLKLDSSGNLYGTGPGGVWIISPQGKPLGRIEAPELPANVAWGDDGRTLYMTARTSIYRIRLSARGPMPCCR